MRLKSSYLKSSSLALNSRRAGEKGLLMAELYAALAIFSMLVMAVAAPLAMNQSMVRKMTTRAVVMEIVDGEAELLAAGLWRKYGEGEQDYAVSCDSAKSLPKGRFVLRVDASKIRLEWREQLRDGREIVRVEREFRRQP